MEKENKEIPFGAKDSELYKFEYTIPEGYEARIEDGKVIVKKKESEDERIRKALVKTFEKKLEIGFEWTEFGIPNRSVLDWLEKQKEPQNNSDAPNESSWEGTTSSSDNGRNLDELAREYIDGVKQYHPTPTWDLMQTAVCYGYHLGEEVGSEGVESVKPIEWSEEDERMVEIAEECATNKDFVFETLEKQLSFLDWLKSLPERFNVKPKQEWSEEDEAAYNAFICEVINEKMNPTIEQIKWLRSICDRLKSLRPQPHWKPSM